MKLSLTFVTATLELSHHMRRDFLILSLNACVKKPIIVSDAGGNVEAITDRETGLVFPSGDATALSKSMLHPC